MPFQMSRFRTVSRSAACLRNYWITALWVTPVTSARVRVDTVGVTARQPEFSENLAICALHTRHWSLWLEVSNVRLILRTAAPATDHYVELYIMVIM